MSTEESGGCPAVKPTNNDRLRSGGVKCELPSLHPGRHQGSYPPDPDDPNQEWWITTWGTHTLLRTNPKGKGIDFIGRCVVCGEENLPAEAAAQQCPIPNES